jgi:acetate kinase
MTVGTPEATGRVLVLNAGSSSLKYRLLDSSSGEVSADGIVERIGEPSGHALHRAGGRTWSWAGPVADSAAALDVVRARFDEAGAPLSDEHLLAVGHRVVHGGDRFAEPVIVDAQVLAAIRQLSVLAPLHNPANAAGIERAMAVFPGVPQVAVFDTAFFRTLPPAAYTYAIDADLAAEHQVRRYGFHGTSHEYVSAAAAEYLGRPPGEVNQVVLHLGNGASISAVSGGRAVETSMGLTPLEGLVMGTRGGDIDPGALLHLQRSAGLGPAELDHLLNRRSGILGLAGVVDFRDLHRLIAAGDRRARLAFDVYCHRARKYVGAYLAVLGRVDAVVFTAGIGENDPLTRAGILEGLGGLGIAVDPDRNAAPSVGARTISPDGTPTAVLVVPTDEELAIARKSAALVGHPDGRH